MVIRYGIYTKETLENHGSLSTPHESRADQIKTDAEQTAKNILEIEGIECIVIREATELTQEIKNWFGQGEYDVDAMLASDRMLQFTILKTWNHELARKAAM